MSALQRILFPVDLSANFPTLSAAARRMFDRVDVEIVMLYVIEGPSRSIRGMEAGRAMARMEFLAHQKFGLASVSSRVEQGHAAECIVNYAQTHGVDVIVMPAGSRESLRRNSLGHVTEEVLLTAPCAVWVESTGELIEVTRAVCCAVALDDDDGAVLSRSAEIAGTFSAPLTIIYNVSFESPMAEWWEPDTVERDVRFARLRVDEARRRFAPAARMHVEAGRCDTVVSRVLHRLQAGLLIASRQEPALTAAAMGCSVLRLSIPVEAGRDAQPRYARVLQRTA